MTEPTDPFMDLGDPFAPETVRLSLADGTDIVDIGATALNHIEAPLPRINSSVMREGDVLTVEFDDDHTDTFEVSSLETGSLVFGSESITHKTVLMSSKSEDNDESEEIRLFGSAISPSGVMMTPGAVRVGSHMVTSKGVSTGTIRTFDLKRPDENGELKSVMLNQKEDKPESDSFSHAKKVFEDLEVLLQEDGFRFGDKGDNSLLGRYTKVNGNLLVRATRQGFGSGIIPQDEIYVYDAKTQILRGLRNIPTEGILQALVVKGVTKDIFQKAFIAYRDGSTPDWRHPLTLSKSGIHALSDFVPVVSYTWLSPDQESPVITVLEDGERIGDKFKTPKHQGDAFVENMKAHGGEDLIDSVQETLGIDPHDQSHVYDSLDVDLYPGEKPKAHSQIGYLWGSEDRVADFTNRVANSVRVSYGEQAARLTIDGHTIHINTDIDKQVDILAKTTRRTLGITQRAVGRRVLSRLRARRS